MVKTGNQIVGVWPLAGFDKILHYRVPEHLAGKIPAGALVKVPVGHRFTLAVVYRVDVKADVPESRLKSIVEAIYPMPVLTPDMVNLINWMVSYYGCKRESIIEAMIPSAVRLGKSALMEKTLSVAKKLKKEELAQLEKRAPAQYKVYQFLLQERNPLKKGVVIGQLKTSAAVIKSLVEKGIIAEEAERAERVAYDDEFSKGEHVSSQAITLNEEQRSAVESVNKSLDEAAFVVHLLQGVTGSGKTEVYLNALQKALDMGGSVIFLVPEVALTPQTVGRLRSKLLEQGTNKVVVWHSLLSDGERLDGWLALARGEARVVVGARSAIFAPLQNVKLIIVDEEHEPAYKQDEQPRYHGRDVAVYRAMLNKAVCLLGSATPSLESHLNVTNGKYLVNHLTKRVDDRKLPLIHVVDMRREIMKRRGLLTISDFLAEKIRERHEKREQIILFINRRGYSKSMICQECGYVAECRHCSVAMTYHRTDDCLHCHMCGAEKKAPYHCPECKSDAIRRRGIGTQKVEEVVQQIVPSARIVRMDADAMRKKNLFREILGDFRTGKIDILVGTQMLAKGLDFPNVTLVGLVDADISLHTPDFRANERTFQLMVQVAGRSGRGDLSGEVVVQTFTPHAMPIQFGRQADVVGFSEEEMSIRREFRYPPYRHLVQHLIRGPNPDKVSFLAEQWAKKVTAAIAEQSLDVELRGPVPCAIEKIKDSYRFQIWYFTNQVTRLVALLSELQKDFIWSDDVTHVLDVDPSNVG
ncbi:MAG: primosomal protein N' [Opitutaceae bacterium]|nr:primosomal protein N' [Opitutaceae bacterium]